MPTCVWVKGHPLQPAHHRAPRWRLPPHTVPTLRLCWAVHTPSHALVLSPIATHIAAQHHQHSRMVSLLAPLLTSVVSAASIPITTWNIVWVGGQVTASLLAARTSPLIGLTRRPSTVGLEPSTSPAFFHERTMHDDHQSRCFAALMSGMAPTILSMLAPPINI